MDYKGGNKQITASNSNRLEERALTTLLILGAGAAGMIAGIAAKRENPKLTVRIVEHMDRPGKKILATGNGRCNFTNRIVGPRNFHGNNPEFTRPALEKFTVEDSIAFFSDLGIYPREEEEGKIFPYSGTATAILDALRFELEKLQVELIFNFNVKKIEPHTGGYRVRDVSGRSLTCDKLLVTTGGKAYPTLGSDGSGYMLLTALGHRLTPLSPALTQIKTAGIEVRGAQGIKFDGIASAEYHGALIDRSQGEILFTSYGLSGPPIFQLSTWVALGQCDTIALDFMPELSEQKVLSLLEQRKTPFIQDTMEKYFSGLFHKRIGNMIAHRAGIEKLSLPVSKLTPNLLSTMAALIKRFPLAVTGLNDWANAQVTAGGISTDEFNPETLESLICSGIYAAGEVLDIFGDCGGFNLQWAWSSGVLAGRSAATSGKDT